jgi:hypothetical protein
VSLQWRRDRNRDQGITPTALTATISRPFRPITVLPSHLAVLVSPTIVFLSGQYRRLLFSRFCVPRHARKNLHPNKAIRVSGENNEEICCGDIVSAFSKSESKMNAQLKKQKLSNEIADAIVDLVNTTDGPVLLSQVERHVPGFKSKKQSSWDYIIENSGNELLIWSGMSKAGYQALSEVISGRRVALQWVNMLPYILDDCVLNRDGWLPSMLVPAKAANLETPRRLLRASEFGRNCLMERAVAENRAGYRILTPGPLRFTADQFSLGNGIKL